MDYNQFILTVRKNYLAANGTDFCFTLNRKPDFDFTSGVVQFRDKHLNWEMTNRLVSVFVVENTYSDFGFNVDVEQ